MLIWKKRNIYFNFFARYHLAFPLKKSHFVLSYYVHHLSLLWYFKVCTQPEYFSFRINDVLFHSFDTQPLFLGFIAWPRKQNYFNLDLSSYSADNVEKVISSYVKYICIYLTCMDISVKNSDRNIKKSKIDSIFNFKHIFKRMKINVKKYFLCTII